MLTRQHLQPLMQFDGNRDLWPLFYAQYKETSIWFDNPTNIGRLRIALKGKAFSAVQGPLSLPDNLEEVIDILKGKYGNERFIIKRKMRALDELSIISERKPSSITNFYEFIQDLVATFKHLDATAYLESPQTVDALEEKLSTEMRRAFIRKHPNHSTNINGFIAFLKPYYSVAIHQEHQEKPETGRRNLLNIHQEDVDTNDYQTSSHQSETNKKNPHLEVKHKQSVYNCTSPSIKNCIFCRKHGHIITDCSSFIGKPLNNKYQFLRKGRWCFMCLKGRHFADKCYEKKNCGISNCKELHHPLLHNTQDPGIISHHSSTERSETLFKVLPVTLYNKGKRIDTWAFLDDGSSLSLVTKELADAIDISGPQSELCLSWTNGAVQKVKNSKVVSFEISGAATGKRFKMDNVRTVEKMNLPIPVENWSKAPLMYQHLKNIKLPNVPSSSPGLLIGLSHANIILSHNVKEGAWNEPVASQTKLGCVIFGNTNGMSSKQDAYTCYVCECDSTEKRLQEEVKNSCM
jgi:hypothetical protein